PLSGIIKVPDDAKAGYLVFKAAYKDKGFDGLPSIETVETLGLRDPRIFISDMDTTMNMRLYTPHFKQPNHLIPSDSMSFIGLSHIDLTGIDNVGLDIV